MRSSAMFLAVVGIVASLTWDVRAELVEFEFSGAVTRIQTGDWWLGLPTEVPAPWNKVNVGDSWSLKYTFDSTTLPYLTHIEEDGGGCAWYAAIQACRVKVGKAAWQPNYSHFQEYGTKDIMAFDNYPDRDEYDAYIGCDNMLIELFFWGPERVWDSYELPLCGDIPLGSFTYRCFWLMIYGPDWEIEFWGSVDQHSCRTLEDGDQQ